MSTYTHRKTGCMGIYDISWATMGLILWCVDRGEGTLGEAGVGLVLHGLWFLSGAAALMGF